MAKKPRINSSDMKISSTQANVDPNRGPSTTPTPSANTPPRTRQINAAPALEHRKSGRGDDDDAPWSLAKVIAISAAMIHIYLPFFINWIGIVALIFGGCCSNVFALESIIKWEPESGLLITFVQFVVTALVTLPTYFSARRPPFFLKRRRIPLTRLIISALMFFAVNMLNNFAFGYNISVPVHIILRSGGSVMTMLVGYVWGKRYTSMQILSVAMLTAGIGVAAMADAQAKGKTKSTSSTRIDSDFITGLIILAVAQLLSAMMGIFTEVTYSKHGRHWHENLFYQHFLSIPMFYPFFPSLLKQFKKLVYSEPIQLSPSLYQVLHKKSDSRFGSGDLQLPPMALTPSVLGVTLPKHVFNLALNAGTQFACIRGVNALSARKSALGVSIALNVRKLVSLCVSLWLFGNKLPPGVLLGAVIVFGSTSIWAWEGQRIGKKDSRRGKMR